MAYSENLQRRTYLAGTSVVQVVGVPGMAGSVEPNVGTQYRIVKVDTANKDQVQLATGGAGEIIAGVTTTKAQNALTPVAVAYRGRVPVIAGAALTYGQYVKSDGTGRAVVGAVTDGVGVVVEAAGGAGVLATIDLELA
jgi:hypothetical protein